MTTWLVSIILFGTIYLLVTEVIPVDLTAVCIMVILVLLGILTPKEAVSGIAHPAVITVGSMFIISKGMVRTGAVEFLSRYVIRFTKGNIFLSLCVILVIVAISSAFINNTPVVILFIPVVMSMCCEFGLSPSKFLIPISYASILAGTCTLIGTSTNIIISDLSAQYGYEAFSMFELSALGIPVAVTGILFLVFASPKLMPSLVNPICQIKDSEHRRYLTELTVPEESRFVGMNAIETFTEKYPGIEVVEVIRNSRIYQTHRGPLTVEANDQLLVKGSLNELVEILRHEKIIAPFSEKSLKFTPGKNEPIVIELIVPPQSRLLGQRLLETDLMRDKDINIIAIKRSNLQISEKQFHDARLRVGDILLIWCTVDKLPALRTGKEYILIEDVFEEIVHKRKAWMSLGIFSALISAATLGLADIMTCALTGALLMIMSGCLQMRDVYRSLQGDVLLLIAGTIALGAAMTKTGTSQLYAEAFLSVFSGYSPKVILGGIIVLTSISSQILSNNATAVLIFPIALSTALGLGVDPKPFIIGICFGASACFMTPFGYQTNLLVFGPGGYRFTDYMKMGIPLNIFVLIAGTLFIPHIWPF